MFQQKIGNDLSEEDRLQMLRDHCDGIEDEHEYLHIYDDFELEIMKDQLSEVSIKIKDIEERKKEEMAKFKAELDPFNLKKNILIENLKEKQRIVVEQVYLVRDDKEQMIGYYNANGDLVDEQPMVNEQMQGRLGFN